MIDQVNRYKIEDAVYKRFQGHVTRERINIMFSAFIIEMNTALNNNKIISIKNFGKFIPQNSKQIQFKTAKRENRLIK